MRASGGEGKCRRLLIERVWCRRCVSQMRCDALPRSEPESSERGGGRAVTLTMPMSAARAPASATATSATPDSRHIRPHDSLGPRPIGPVAASTFKRVHVVAGVPTRPNAPATALLGCRRDPPVIAFACFRQRYNGVAADEAPRSALWCIRLRDQIPAPGG